MSTLQIILLILAFLIIYLIWSNLSIQTTHYDVKSPYLNSDFNNYKIVQISDFHNADFGKNQHRIIDKIKKENPDIITITGDFIDSKKTKLKLAMTFIEQAVKIAPVYFVTGNHESRMPHEYSELKDYMIQHGVIVLEDESTYIEVNKSKIKIIGLHDPQYIISEQRGPVVAKKLNEKLQKLDNEKDTFRLLLAHRPEYHDVYDKNQIDLTLSGHAHGGQFRIPFLGGVFGPNQGYFSKYTEGQHQQDRAQLIVSRGLGQGSIPIRINNRRELVVITLNQTKN